MTQARAPYRAASDIPRDQAFHSAHLPRRAASMAGLRETDWKDPKAALWEKRATHLTQGPKVNWAVHRDFRAPWIQVGHYLLGHFPAGKSPAERRPEEGSPVV